MKLGLELSIKNITIPKNKPGNDVTVTLYIALENTFFIFFIDCHIKRIYTYRK